MSSSTKMDTSKIRVSMKFNHWLPKVLRVGGITLGARVFFARPQKEVSPALILHELQHVLQIDKEGRLRFYSRYICEYLVNLIKYRNHQRAYRMISYEQEAYRIQDEATRKLMQRRTHQPKHYKLHSGQNGLNLTH